jgi:hypothetical protein
MRLHISSASMRPPARHILKRLGATRASHGSEFWRLCRLCRCIGRHFLSDVYDIRQAVNFPGWVADGV